MVCNADCTVMGESQKFFFRHGDTGVMGVHSGIIAQSYLCESVVVKPNKGMNDHNRNIETGTATHAFAKGLGDLLSFLTILSHLVNRGEGGMNRLIDKSEFCGVSGVSPTILIPSL